MAEYILTTVISEQLKIAVVRGQPLIQNFAHTYGIVNLAPFF
jgi:hypothetical protein